MTSDARARFFERTNDLVLIISDASLEIVDANPRTVERLGTPLNGLLGRKLFDLVAEPEDIVEGWLERLRRHEFGVFECGLKTATGAVIPVEISADLSGDDGLVNLVGRETAARLGLEDALGGQIRHLRDVLDAAAGPVLVMNTSGVVSFVNRRARSLLGDASKSPLGRPVEDASLWPADGETRSRIRDTVRTVANGEVHRIDEDVLDAIGDTRRMDLTFQPIVDRHGDISHVVISGVDVTDRERVRTGESLEDAASSDHSGAGRLDGRGVWIAADSILCELLGITSGDVESHHIWACEGVGDADVIRRQFDRLVEGEIPLVMLRFLAEDEKPLQLTISPCVEHPDTFDVVVTDTRAIGDERIDIVRSAAIEQMKAGLLASVSHEIRTPMNAILGLTNVVLEDELPPKAASLLGVVSSSARQLMRLLDDVLDLSALESSRLRVIQDEFDPKRAVGHVVEMLRPPADEKNLALTFECEGGVPEVLVGDEARVAQIATNLLSNAIKYTEKGHVAVRLSTRPVAGGEIDLVIRVEDSGVGIAPEDVELIFEPFERAEAQRNETAGAGLGLSIVRRLVERMNGRVDVSSEPGEGSVFTAMVRLSVTESTPQESDAGVDVEDMSTPLSILAVDDTEANRILVEQLLTRRGHSVTLVDNAPAAIELLERCSFDCVLMDVNMPGMDGLEATRIIRRLEAAQRVEPLPIIAMTAHAMAGDREQCISAGMTAYLAKPIDARELMAAVESAGASISSQSRLEPAAALDEPVLDVRSALDRLAGDTGLFARMLDILEIEGPRLVDEIAAVHTIEDAARAAHTLKNQAATVGAMSTSQLAASIEQRILARDEITEDAVRLAADLSASLVALRERAARDAD